MFPDSHDALPLPPRPNLEQYKKRAKDLLKASQSPDSTALRIWASIWITSLLRLSDHGAASSVSKAGSSVILSGVAAQRSSAATQSKDPSPPGSSNTPKRNSLNRFIPDHRTTPLETFARQHLSEIPTLTAAQFVIARAHGFESWPRLAQHLEAVARANSAVNHFEHAADAIVIGDADTLAHLLKKYPDLIRARSTRRHQATLLHYVSANGIEDYRQRTPENIVTIAGLLLHAGADVNALADVYGGSTTLALAATSVHPERAGVQSPLMQILLDHGAAIDTPDSPSLLINACLANGRVRSAEFLATHGARIDLEAAAGLGQLDVVKTFFAESGVSTANSTEIATHKPSEQKERALHWACEYGRNPVVNFLLDRSVPIQSQANTGQTALHWAVIGGQLDTIKLLLERGAKLEAQNSYGGTALDQALWSATHGDPAIDYAPIIDLLKRLRPAGNVPQKDEYKAAKPQECSP